MTTLRGAGRLLTAGDAAGAQRAIARLPRGRAVSPTALAFRGAARLSLGRPRLALKDFDEALRKDARGCSWALLCRAWARLECGRREEALDDLEAFRAAAHDAPAGGTEALEKALRVPARAMGPAVARSVRWKDAARWAPWAQRFEALFSEMEYATVLAGVRPLVLRTQHRDASAAFLERARMDGLRGAVLFHVRSFAGFSSRFEPADPRDPAAFTHVAVARGAPALSRVLSAYRDGLGIEGHDSVGELLGYPDCCRRAFERRFVRAGIADPVFEAAASTTGARRVEDSVSVRGVPVCNVLLRYSNWRMIPWMPCRLDCPESAKRGDDWLRVGRGLDGPAARRLLDVLASPMRWRQMRGRAQARVLGEGLDFAAASDDRPGTREVRWKAV